MIVAETKKKSFNPICNKFGHHIKNVGDEYKYCSPYVYKTYQCIKCKFCNYKAVRLEEDKISMGIPLLEVSVELTASFDHWLVYNKPYRNARNG